MQENVENPLVSLYENDLQMVEVPNRLHLFVCLRKADINHLVISTMNHGIMVVQ